MSRSVLVRTSLYDEWSQVLNGVNADDIRPLGDRVLVMNLPESEKIGSLWVPEICQNAEQVRQGIIVAVGPGDKYIESVETAYRLDSDGRVPIKRVAVRIAGERARLPMEVKVGDRVLFRRREDERFYVEGHEMYLIHVEQAVLALLEEEERES